MNAGLLAGNISRTWTSFEERSTVVRQPRINLRLKAGAIPPLPEDLGLPAREQPHPRYQICLGEEDPLEKPMATIDQQHLLESLAPLNAKILRKLLNQTMHLLKSLEDRIHLNLSQGIDRCIILMMTHPQARALMMTIQMEEVRL